MEEKDSRFSTQEMVIIDKLIEQNEKKLQKKVFLLAVKGIYHTAGEFSPNSEEAISLVENVYSQIIAVQEVDNILTEEEWEQVKPLLDKVDQKLFGTKR